ncbi:TonB-dependent receptor domain-containing protein [Luteimonas sp. R10]|uniref:TonB-dependent receptor domain-containing protein n=1 Tax=Luteimonas sp. R10 TaxID=3108176 RepID=UPI003085A101|nr:TonB-dependent receptor [Luteimonas sp. R10]
MPNITVLERIRSISCPRHPLSHACAVAIALCCTAVNAQESNAPAMQTPPDASGAAPLDRVVVETQAVEAQEEETASEASDAQTLETVTVTGSRIRRTGAESNHSLSVIGKEKIEAASTANVIDLLNEEPQMSLGTDSQVNIRSSGIGGDKNTGVATANLRALGSTRTLTLVNGRRHVAGTTASSAVDLNTISKTSLERVEIVTGGSSAVYGADAIAGVINLTTLQQFDGLRGTVQLGTTEDGGGDTRNFSITAGKNSADYRGNVMLSVSHDREEPLYWIDRRWGFESGGMRGSLSYVANPEYTGPDSSVPRFVPMAGVSGITYRQYGHPVITTPIGSSPAYSYSFDDAGNLIPFDHGTRLVNSQGQLLTSAVDCPDCYMSYQLGTARNELERTGIELQASYWLLEDGDGAIRSADVFFEGKRYEVEAMQLHGYSSFAGSGPSIGNRGGYAIRADNPFAPTELVDLMQSHGLTHVDVTRINNDFGQDVDEMRAALEAGRPLRNRGALLDMHGEYKTERYVAGVRGMLGNDWNYEIYGNYGKTRARFTQSDFMDTLFRQQIDAVRDPDTGQIVCRSTLTDPGNGCVPIDIMRVGSTSMEDLAYSYRRPVLSDTIVQKNVAASVDGTLFSWNSPGSGAELPVDFAAGVEYRREFSSAVPDADGLSGDLFYMGPRVATVGRYSSWEAFAELNLPLLKDVRFAESLEVGASYRYQNYTTTGSDGSYGFSGSWTPVSDIKFRSAFAHAVRAPNVHELYAGTEQGVANITDPCDIRYLDSGPAPANRAANCRQLLGDAAGDFLQTPHSKRIIQQGNTGLDAETADTITAGVVLAPRWVPNLTLTADYFSIEIEGIITSLGATQIAENCVDSPTLDNPFCGNVSRDASGNIDVVVSQVFNLAHYNTRGWDFGASYSLDLDDRGRIVMSAKATNLLELIYDPDPTNPSLRSRQDRVNYSPKWRGNFTTGYRRNGFSVDWNARYLGSVIRSWNDRVGDFSMTDAHVKSGSFIQHDLRFGYDTGNYQLYVGVNNVFDRYAPMKPFTYLSPMYPRFGRNYYAGVKVDF